jgi:HlyD family secretion protein
MNKRTVVWIVIIVVLAALGYGAYRFFAGRKDGAPRFTTQKVDKGPIIARVTASGTLSALVTVQVGSQVSGRLMEITADFNSPVTKDQVIAKLDPELFQASVEQAQANLLADQGNLEKAKVQAIDADRISKRSQELVGRKLIAQADADTAQANADAAKANVTAMKGQVERDRAALSMAQVNLKYTIIKSPINGTVISRTVDVGQTVAASLQAPTLFTIAEDLKKMQVDTSVAEADVGKLTPGMNATFTVDAFPGEKFKGTVRQIRNAATVVQNVVTYDAVVLVHDESGRLLPGMTAQVVINTSTHTHVLAIPLQALLFRPLQRGSRPTTSSSGGAPAGGPLGGVGFGGPGGPGGGGGGGQGGGAGAAVAGAPGSTVTVWILKNGQPSAVRVVIGVSDNRNVEIRSGGLKEGDRVIVAAVRGGSRGGQGGRGNGQGGGGGGAPAGTP